MPLASCKQEQAPLIMLQDSPSLTGFLFSIQGAGLLLNALRQLWHPSPSYHFLCLKLTHALRSAREGTLHQHLAGDLSIKDRAFLVVTPRLQYSLPLEMPLISPVSLKASK